MMFKRNKNKTGIKTGVHTPKFRNPTPPPPLKPPTSGSNAQKPYAALFEREPKTSPGIILPNDICTITIICPYETPCGWCTKWDKKCDKKIPERGLRAKGNLIDDAMDSDFNLNSELDDIRSGKGLKHLDTDKTDTPGIRKEFTND